MFVGTAVSCYMTLSISSAATAVQSLSVCLELSPAVTSSSMRAARALAADEIPAVAVLADARLFIETCDKQSCDNFRAASAASLSTMATRTGTAETSNNSSRLSWSRFRLPPLQPQLPEVEARKEDKASKSVRRHKRRHRDKAAAKTETSQQARTAEKSATLSSKPANACGLERDEIVKGATYTWVRSGLLGRGSMGTVWKARIACTDEIVAVKEVDLDRDLQVPSEIANEVATHRQLNHPNIVKLLGTDAVLARYYIYLEFMPGGSLRQVLKRDGPLREVQICNYACQLVAALSYMHRQAVLHRDVKTGNILLTEDMKCVKLADFGCSKKSKVSAKHTFRGSVLWMAPEIINGEKYGCRADIWSFGCTLIEMITAQPPWGKFQSQMAAMMHIACCDKSPPLEEEVSPHLRDLVSVCTRRAPKERPRACKLMKHDFLNSTGRELPMELT